MGAEEPESQRRGECPFTVEPGADGPPTEALFDMGRTLGTQSGFDPSPGSTCVAWMEGMIARVSAIRQEWPVEEVEVGKRRRQTSGDVENVNVPSAGDGAGTPRGRGGQSLVGQSSVQTNTWRSERLIVESDDDSASE